MGAVLIQGGKPVAYFSEKLSNRAQQCSIYEREYSHGSEEVASLPMGAQIYHLDRSKSPAILAKTENY